MSWALVNNGTYPFIVASSSGVEYLTGTTVKSSSGVSYTVRHSVLASNGAVYYPIRDDEHWTTFNSAQSGNWGSFQSNPVFLVAAFAGASFSELAISGAATPSASWSNIPTEA